MKDLSQMTASELKFYNFLVDDSKNWWPCETENFDLTDSEDNPEYVGKNGMIAYCFTLYTTNWGEWADECIRRYKEDKYDAFLSKLEMEEITYKDEDFDDDEFAYEEYLKGPSGKFLDLINEDTWLA